MEDKDKKNPFFSIIIPVWNTKQDYLLECVNSVLGQTYNDFEVVLVDDGSQEEVALFCDYCAKQDERVKVIHQANQGVSVARNNGILNSCGKWIIFVDADDWLELNACEILREKLSEKNYDVLMFKGIKETDRPIEIEYGLEADKTYDLGFLEDKEYMYLQAMSGTKGRCSHIHYSWDKVFNRDFIIKNKLQYPKGVIKSEDMIFIAQCVGKAKKWHFIDVPLYHYRINEFSVCNRYSKNIDEQRIMLSEKLGYIAEQLNREIAEMKMQPAYNKILKEYDKFMFGIITDVFFLKFYHSDNPNKSTRRKDAKRFLRNKKIRKIINGVSFFELSKRGRLKKFLLKLGFVNTYYKLYTKNKKRA